MTDNGLFETPSELASLDMEALAKRAHGCQQCRLASSRTNVVFGVGRADADLMLVGEAPGYHEDRRGEPFVGPAGQLLDQLLNEVGLARSDVYIANVLKCRPPNNRDPLDDEIEACKGFLARQLDLVQPLVIATLGNFATKLILGRTVGITKLRGRVFPYRNGSVVIPTYHPAALLRASSPQKVAEAKSDFRLIAVEVRRRHASAGSSPDSADQAQPSERTESTGSQLGLFG